MELTLSYVVCVCVPVCVCVCVCAPKMLKNKEQQLYRKDSDKMSYEVEKPARDVIALSAISG